MGEIWRIYRIGVFGWTPIKWLSKYMGR